MFSLRFDVLFPSIASARDMARRLNQRRKVRRIPLDDPRERKRIWDELRLARDKQKAEDISRRYHIF